MAALVAIVVVLWIYFLWSRRKFYAFALKMPGPWGLPIIGVGYKLLDIKGTLYSLPKLAAPYKSKTIFTFVGTIPVLYTLDPKVVEVLLNSSNCLKKSKIYEAVSRALGDGLVTLNSPVWNSHRKLLNPAFKPKILANFLPIFNKMALDLCVQLDPLIGCGETTRIRSLTLDTTFKAAVSTTMGSGFSQCSYTTFVEDFKTCQYLIIESIVKFWRRTIFYRGTETYKRYTQTQNNILNFVKDIVNKKLKEDHQEKDKDASIFTEESLNIAKKNHVFIDRAIELYQMNEFSFDDVISESNIIVLAASDTSSVMAFSTLLHLAIHPQFQENLFEEIITVFPNERFDVTSEDLRNLVYMDMCVNETLRHSPSVPLIGRSCTDGVELSKDTIIPKGTELLIDIFNIHRDKDVWGPNANDYNPDNFLPANVASRHNYSFIPFSKGQRNCIGWQYAYMLVKVILVQVLRKYRFSTKWRMEDIKYCEGFSLEYKTVPTLEVHRR